MGLFEKINFISHSGLELDFKIECDALDDHDWQTLAHIIGKKYMFGEIVAIPNGGLKLGDELTCYTDSYSDTILIVDDVLTTGNSMEAAYKEIKEESPSAKIKGVVVFARSKPAYWIDPIFQMWEEN